MGMIKLTDFDEEGRSLYVDAGTITLIRPGINGGTILHAQGTQLKVTEDEHTVEKLRQENM